MNRTRALLLATAVPLLIVAGVLGSALLGGDSALRAPARTGSAAGTVGAAGTAGAATGSGSRFVPAGADRIDAGTGARGVAIFRPRDAPGTEPVVLFLHGWLAVDPAHYGSWIAHLVHAGATVIYPAYQEAPSTDTVSPLANTLMAVRAALERLRLAPSRLVVVGHSAGGALAVDYAASARAAGLPVPAAVFSVYPGRSPRGIALRIPAISARRIPARTRVLVLAGANDRVVGSRVARAIARTAPHATLRIVRDPRAADHGAPGRSGVASRRAFWAPLDRLIVARG